MSSVTVDQNRWLVGDKPVHTRRSLRNQRGQGLAEAAISILLLTLLAFGIVQFGYAWVEIAMITHAARDSARAAAIVPASSRDASGIISAAAKTQILDNLLLPTLQGVMTSGTASTLRSASSITQSGAGVTPATVTVTVGSSGTTIPYMFTLPLVGGSFTVNKSVTFRDEGR